jgi:ElaB/YqjD/DUF883 family membrane-anchored ribosome-binding protein
MSELADELARHARPEHVKEIAAEKVSEWKERAKEMASEKAVELKEQAKEAVKEKASELKTHAKEAVMQKTMDVKERVDTPRGWSLLGAIVGAGVGAVLMKKAFSVREERAIGTGVGEFRYRGESYTTGTDLGTGSDIGTSGTSIGTGIKDRAMGAVEQVRDQAMHLRERIPSGAELKGQAMHWFDRALESQPLMLAVGSIALGVFASLILPVSNRERRLIEPAKSKVQEGISQLGDQLEQKLQGQETRETGSATGSVGTMGSTPSSTFGNIESSESMMGSERPSLMGSDRSDTMTAPAGSRIPPLDDLSTKIH